MNTVSILKILRGFKKTGYLIRTLIQNTVDMSYFLMIMLIMIASFAVMFQINMVKPEDFGVCQDIQLGDDTNEERCP